MSLLTAALAVNAQATGTKPGDPVTKGNTFDVGMYMGPQWKINLLLDIRRPERLRITLKDSHDTVVYQEYVRRQSASYWRKFDFEQSEPGVYRFEISDGQKTIVRTVEVVHMPTIESQRYVTYGPQTSQ